MRPGSEKKEQRHEHLRTALWLLAALAALAMLSGMSGEARADTITVSASGGDHTTIQAAVDAANPGDTITVDDGTYTENVVIDKNLILEGNSEQNTIIDTEDSGVALKVTADDVTISGFKLLIGSAYEDRGIEAIKANNGDFSNIRVVASANNVPVGFYLKYSNSTYLSDSRCTGTNAGLILEGSESARIIDNIFTDCNHNSIIVRDCESVFIEGNECTDSRLGGIYLEDSILCEIRNNTITGTGTDGIELFGSDGNMVVDNQCSDAVGAFLTDTAGIYIHDSDENDVRRNTVEDNVGYGIHLEDSGNHTLRKNTCTGNTYDFWVFSEHRYGYEHTIPTSNTAGGKPVYYFLDETGSTTDGNIIDPGFVAIIDSESVTVRNLDMSDSVKGLLVAYSYDIIVEDCVFTGNEDGLYLWYTTDSTIDECVITNNERYGVFARGVRNTTFRNNEFWGSGTADMRFIMGSYDNTVTGNEFIGGDGRMNSEDGIKIEDSGTTSIEDNVFDGINSTAIQISDSGHNTISDNSIANLSGSFSVNGIYLDDSYHTTIEDNTISGVDGEGIYALRSDDLTITGNTIRDNEVGVYLFGYWIDNKGMTDVSIQNNDIVSNSEIGVDAANNFEDDVNAKNNWWGSDSGPSGEGPGTGDDISDLVLYDPWLDESIHGGGGNGGTGGNGGDPNATVATLPVWNTGDTWSWSVSVEFLGIKEEYEITELVKDADSTATDYGGTEYDCYENQVSVYWPDNGTTHQGIVWLWKPIFDVIDEGPPTYDSVSPLLELLNFPFAVGDSWTSSVYSFNCTESEDLIINGVAQKCFKAESETYDMTLWYSPGLKHIVKGSYNLFTEVKFAMKGLEGGIDDDDDDSMNIPGLAFLLGFGCVICIMLPLICLGVGIWNYLDAEKRGKSGALWLILNIFIFPILPAIVWLIIRPDMPAGYGSSGSGGGYGGSYAGSSGSVGGSDKDAKRALKAEKKREKERLKAEKKAMKTGQPVPGAGMPTDALSSLESPTGQATAPMQFAVPGAVPGQPPVPGEGVPGQPPMPGAMPQFGAPPVGMGQLPDGQMTPLPDGQMPPLPDGQMQPLPDGQMPPMPGEQMPPGGQPMPPVPDQHMPPMPGEPGGMAPMTPPPMAGTPYQAAPDPGYPPVPEQQPMQQPQQGEWTQQQQQPFPGQQQYPYPAQQQAPPMYGEQQPMPQQPDYGQQQMPQQPQQQAPQPMAPQQAQAPAYPPAQQPPDASQWQCPGCGNAVAASYKFCVHCGTQRVG